MKKGKMLKNKYFLLVVFGVISSLILTIMYLPVEDSFVSIIGSFDINLDPNDTAPASVIQELALFSKSGFGTSGSTTTSSGTTLTKLFSSVPNYFSSCNFGDRVSYTDANGKKFFLAGNQRDITPISTNSIITTQTNRNISDFIIDTHGSCNIKSGFSSASLKAVADSGTLKIDVFYAKPDGTMTKIYSKSTNLSVKGLDLSSDKTLLSAKIPVSELENKMTHPSDSYKSNLRIKTSLNLQLHYTGAPSIDTQKWMIGGISENTLKVTVTNDKYQCLIGCLFTNKEIKTELTPSDGNIKVKSIINFKVTLPEWNADQGSPSFKLVNSGSGVEITQKSPLTLTKTGTSGVGSKSLLSPSNVGKYDIIITHPNRDTAVIPLNVYKEVIKEPEDEGQKCDVGYVLIDGVCFLEKQECTDISCNVPPLDPIDLLSNFNPEDYYGYAVLLIIILIIVIIIKAVFKKSPQPRY